LRNISGDEKNSFSTQSVGSELLKNYKADFQQAAPTDILDNHQRLLWPIIRL
jgi:hypothetical protein